MSHFVVSVSQASSLPNYLQTARAPHRCRHWRLKSAVYYRIPWWRMIFGSSASYSSDYYYSTVVIVVVIGECQRNYYFSSVLDLSNQSSFCWRRSPFTQVKWWLVIRASAVFHLRRSMFSFLSRYSNLCQLAFAGSFCCKFRPTTFRMRGLREVMEESSCRCLWELQSLIIFSSQKPSALRSIFWLQPINWLELVYNRCNRGQLLQFLSFSPKFEHRFNL